MHQGFYALLAMGVTRFGLPIQMVQSQGSGRGEFKLDIPTQRLSWKITYAGLTSRVTGVHMHGPGQMGTNGLPFLDLAPNGIRMPLEGSAEVTEAQVQYMISTWAYVNITTERYKDGEIRGQVDGHVSE